MQVKSPKSIDSRSQWSITDMTVANNWRLRHPYLITTSLKVNDSMQVIYNSSPMRGDLVNSLYPELSIHYSMQTAIKHQLHN